MDAITEKLFPILATQLSACLYTSQVFSSSSSIMENAIWRMAAGQPREEKCHVAIAWHASKFGRLKVNSRFFCRCCMDVPSFLHLIVGPKPHRNENPLDDRQNRTDTSSRVSARKAHPVLLLENTCRLSVRPSIRPVERQKQTGKSDGEGGPPACFR